MPATIARTSIPWRRNEAFRPPSCGAHVARTSKSIGGVMIQGLRTVIYPVNDITKGKEWYAQVPGRAPLLAEPFYVGFSVGGFELGLIPDGTPSPDGSQAYWGVPDTAAGLERLRRAGGPRPP